MSCKSIIPSKAFTWTLLNDTTTVLDTQGRDCRLKALNGSVNLTLHPQDNEEQKYTLSEGETITFCGKLYLAGKDSVVTGLLYTTL